MTQVQELIQQEKKLKPNGVVDHLNLLVSDLHVHEQTLRAFHWNVHGPNFIGLHKLFEDQYKEIADHLDEVAEHVKMLGYYPVSRMEQVLQFSRLREPIPSMDARKMLEHLVRNILSIRESLENTLSKPGNLSASTEDLLVQTIVKLEKHLYLLQSHLK